MSEGCQNYVKYVKIVSNMSKNDNQTLSLEEGNYNPGNSDIFENYARLNKVRHATLRFCQNCIEKVSNMSKRDVKIMSERQKISNRVCHQTAAMRMSWQFKD